MQVHDIPAESLSVVVRGDFNPSVFSPLWFFTEELIGRTDWEDSDPGVVSRDLSSFRMGWLQVMAQPDRLQMSTVQPEEFVRLRDAAIGTLRTLRSTPISALGINREVHITVDSTESWNRIGDVLAPKEPWEGILESPGMRSVTLLGTRPDGHTGHIQVKVEPSHRFPHSIFVDQNDHFQFAKLPKSGDAQDVSEIEPASSKYTATAISVLQDEWNASLQRAAETQARIADLGDANQ